MPVSSSEGFPGKTWVPGLVIAALAGTVYLALRPPLFNYDGYVYRLQALDSFQPQHLNPHHLLWYPVQSLLVKLTDFFGLRGTIPFQVFGILVNTCTLLLFFRLLLKTSENQIFAASAALFLAFSPKFWFMGYQNQPYPLVFLAIVLFMKAWCLPEGEMPSQRRIFLAGLAAASAAFFQQAAALLIFASVVALLVFGGDSLKQKLGRALLCGAGASALLLGVYLGVSLASGATDARGFPRWTLRYLESQHSLQIRMPESFAKSVMGIFRSMVQSYRIEDYLRGNFSPNVIFAFFAGLGLAGCAGIAWFLWRTGSGGHFLGLLRNRLLFAVCCFTMCAWAAFVFAWEPSGYYWSLNLFPLLVCVGMLLRGRRTHLLPAAFVLLSAWNVYANHSRDKIDSINFPEPLMESIRRQLGGRDIFIVLGRDWFADMDYDLLFTSLDRLPRNPGMAILDWILHPQPKANWRDELRAEIESTLDEGGRVFVAEHVFWPSSYEDLPGASDPFSEFIHEEYEGLDAAQLRRDVEEFFESYDLSESDLKIGADIFLELHRSQ